LGGARAALESWRRGAQPEPEARRAFARPTPRVAAGRWLAARGATAMIDLSDGLAADAAHLAAASEVELRIELGHLPIPPWVAGAATAAAIPPAQFAAEGGEDYELLASLPASFGPGEAQGFSADQGIPLTRIGTVAAGAGARLFLAGSELSLAGFDHFR
jgi:thiamine-monophosphate kinase